MKNFLIGLSLASLVTSGCSKVKTTSQENLAGTNSAGGSDLVVTRVNMNGPSIQADGQTYSAFQDALNQGKIQIVGAYSKYSGPIQGGTNLPKIDSGTDQLLQSVIHTQGTAPLTIKIPVPSRGDYQVNLWARENSQSKFRKIAVTLEGRGVRSDFSFLDFGFFEKASFKVPVSDGVLDLTLSASQGDAHLAGIEVIRLGAGSTTTGGTTTGGTTTGGTTTGGTTTGGTTTGGTTTGGTTTGGTTTGTSAGAPTDPAVPAGPVLLQLRVKMQPADRPDYCWEAGASDLKVQNCSSANLSQRFEFQALSNSATQKPLMFATVLPMYSIVAKGSGQCLAAPVLPADFKPETSPKLGAIRLVACNPADPAQQFAYHPQGEIVSTVPRGYCMGSQESWLSTGNIVKLWVCRSHDNGTQTQIIDPIAIK